MIGPPARVLLVARNAGLANMLAEWLRREDYRVVVASTFEGGKRCLESHPDVIITEVKLEEYNGLHLALRAQGARIPALVLSCGDDVLDKDAAALGASCIGPVLRRDELVAAVAALLTSRAPVAAAEASGIVWKSYRDVVRHTDSFSRTILPN